MGQIEAQANSLCLTKEICLHMETETDLGTFKADKLLLKQAIMNVISNVVDYSPPEGTVYVEAQKPDDFLQISIILREPFSSCPAVKANSRSSFFFRQKGVKCRPSAGTSHFFFW